MHICPARDQLLCTCPAAIENGLTQATKWCLQQGVHLQGETQSGCTKECDFHLAGSHSSLLRQPLLCFLQLLRQTITLTCCLACNTLGGRQGLILGAQLFLQ